MLALVDFPKQIVIALAVTVKYMKGQSNYTAVYISQLTIPSIWSRERLPESLIIHKICQQCTHALVE